MLAERGDSSVQEGRLVVTIHNSKPVELVDLTKSLSALGSQFDSYIKEHATTAEMKKTKLYVKEVRKGSIVIELVEFANATVVPFMDEVVVIVAFAELLNNKLSKVLRKKGHEDAEESEITSVDYKDLSNIVEIVAKDGEGSIHFTGTVNGEVTIEYNLNARECKKIQAIAKGERVRKPELMEGEVLERVLLRWSQTRSDLNQKKGNRAIIDTLSKEEINTLVEDEEVKKKMLHGKDNPLTTVYVVDVRIEFVKERPVYRVLKLYEDETFEIEG